MDSVVRAKAQSGKDAAHRPRIAFLENRYLAPDDVRSWSGLPFHMRRAMETAGFEVIPVRIPEPPPWANWGRWARFAYWKLVCNRRYLRHSEPVLLKHYGRWASLRLKELELDAVFTPSSWLGAYLDTSLPVVLWTDATFANVLNFYDAFSDLAPRSIREGHRAERAALQRCHRAYFSSDWAAQSAVQTYGLEPERAEVLPFGANIETSLTAAQVEDAITSRPETTCRLLFVGVDWVRKGAPLAIEIVRELQECGHDAELTIVGCLPPSGTKLPPGVRLTGFISKATESGRQQIAELFRTSHLFIMPTRADCTPCVFSEANTYALPCITTRVGGIPSVIRDNVNGRTFSLGAEASEYAGYIRGLLADGDRYKELCRASWRESQTRLSWTRSAGRILTQLRACPSPAGSSSGFVGRAGGPDLG